MSRPLRIGHRGAAASAPAHTLACFRRAVALGADGVELDMHRTRDGALVVIHDDTLDQTTNGHGRVAERTLAEIQVLDAGPWKGSEFAGERVPTLEGVAAAPPKRIELFVELKGAGIAEDLARFPRVRVLSFHHPALARSSGANPVHPSFHHVDADLVGEAHAAGLEVFAWTVNEPDDFAQMRALRRATPVVCRLRPRPSERRVPGRAAGQRAGLDQSLASRLGRALKRSDFLAVMNRQPRRSHDGNLPHCR